MVLCSSEIVENIFARTKCSWLFRRDACRPSASRSVALELPANFITVVTASFMGRDLNLLRFFDWAPFPGARAL